MTDMSHQDALKEVAQQAHIPQFGKTEGATDDAVLQLIDALAKASENFQEVTKDKEGKVKPRDASRAGYTFRYADLAAYVAATRPALAAEGLVVTSHMTTDSAGNKTVHTYLMHKAGGYMFSNLNVPHIESDYISQMMQAFGGAVSFIRRHLYTSLLNLVSDDDDLDQRGDEEGPRADMGSDRVSEYAKHPDITGAKSISELAAVMRKFEKGDRAKYADHHNTRVAELQTELGRGE